MNPTFWCGEDDDDDDDDECCVAAEPIGVGANRDDNWNGDRLDNPTRVDSGDDDRPLPVPDAPDAWPMSLASFGEPI